MASNPILREINQFFESVKEKKPEELLITFKGVLYPGGLCSAENFQALERMEFRKDDVILVAYPKCGTNWVRQILNDLTSATSKKKEEASPIELVQMLEFGAPDKFQKIKNSSSPRVFITHLHYDNIPKAVFDIKAKIVVIFRNPKDAAVSYYHFYNNNPGLPTISSWDEFFQKFMSGEVCWSSYFDHALAWNKHMDEENIMIITYEDMKENLYGGVKQIADFLGFCLPEEKIQTIAENATFESMSNKSQETHGKFAPVLFRKVLFFRYC
ncbi:sulfotransferase 6B1-like isoform X2 [Pelodiscus sinensis]|uniref:sulfotransferase 6B1-like isoform X2 n=1 Tax=Pelodiscus sinensis TaxID=13735 RepID=UPI000D72309E|nr:sulfotransferase 6B1-like isoform X2 [Pelodiscus sinensis]|eukprot:XP_025044566.1 sulfotransferase 6B1-like isoform X2 [Pelodiscus sinensis]